MRKRQNGRRKSSSKRMLERNFSVIPSLCSDKLPTLMQADPGTAKREGYTQKYYFFVSQTLDSSY